MSPRKKAPDWDFGAKVLFVAILFVGAQCLFGMKCYNAGVIAGGDILMAELKGNLDAKPTFSHDEVGEALAEAWNSSIKCESKKIVNGETHCYPSDKAMDKVKRAAGREK